MTEWMLLWIVLWMFGSICYLFGRWHMKKILKRQKEASKVRNNKTKKKLCPKCDHKDFEIIDL
jgi:membrane protein DedA with SNARE-associated domain